MKIRSAVSVVCLLSLIFLLVQGCSGPPAVVITQQVSPAVEASLTQPPDQEEAAETPQATQAAVEPTPESASIAAPQPFVLSSEPYEHPEKLFNFYPPKDWELVEETASSAWFEGPGKKEAIRLAGTNTGYRLEEDAFTRFVESRDRNHFGGYQDMAQTGAEIDPAQGVAEVSKRFLLEDTPYRAVSYYLQYDRVMFVFDYWAEEPLFKSRGRSISQFYRGIRVDDASLAAQEPYSQTFEFKGGGDLFSFEVPVAWAYEMIEGDFLKAYTFSSPDEHVLVQMVAYDDGEPLTRVNAGKLALEILRLYYADDVKVSTAQVLQPTSMERLAWHSTRGGYSGVSQFQLRGSAFFLLTVKYDNAYSSYYASVIDRIVNSYTVP